MKEARPASAAMASEVYCHKQKYVIGYFFRQKAMPGQHASEEGKDMAFGMVGSTIWKASSARGNFFYLDSP
jgi:hypothetical protein